MRAVLDVLDCPEGMEVPEYIRELKAEAAECERLTNDLLELGLEHKRVLQVLGTQNQRVNLGSVKNDRLMGELATKDEEADRLQEKLLELKAELDDLKRQAEANTKTLGIFRQYALLDF
jgi:predicted nuclease with TOPRIM domain